MSIKEDFERSVNSYDSTLTLVVLPHHYNSFSQSHNFGLNIISDDRQTPIHPKPMSI